MLKRMTEHEARLLFRHSQGTNGLTELEAIDIWIGRCQELEDNLIPQLYMPNGDIYSVSQMKRVLIAMKRK